MNNDNYTKVFASRIIGALALLTLSSQLSAATITVTGTGDTIAVDGFITLREAITAANTDAISGDAPAGSGADTIDFNIAGAPGTVHTIQPASALPTITGVLTINGYSQPGTSPNSLASGNNAFLAIELDGTNAGASPGLNITAGGSLVRGLVINRFANEGIVISTLGNNVISGNYLGTDQTGQLDRGNGLTGVSLLSSNNLVGGTLAADRNLVSANDSHGILVSGAITGNRILNNYIGSTDAGNVALGNSAAGVSIVGATNTSIGGILSGTGNVIAWNSDEGVVLSSSAGAGNAILGNSIHSNGALGIDLSDDGITANDALDVDVGPNNLQNFPVLNTATTNELGIVVKGTLESTPSTSHRLEFFGNTNADPSGSGEGESYLGFLDVMTDALGNASFTFTSATGQAVDTEISVTATDPNNNTSEFAVDIPIVFFPTSEHDDDDDENDSVFSDDDYFPIPLGFGPPPFPPVPPAPPAPALVPPAPISRVVGVDDPITVQGPVTEIGQNSSSETYSDEKQEQIGCSTFGKTSPAMVGLVSIVLAWLKFRRKRRARA